MSSNPYKKMPIEPVSRAMALLLFSRELARELALLILRPQKRTPGQVANEYDKTVWKKNIEQASWAQFDSVDEYYFTQAISGTILAMVDGAWVKADRREYYRLRNMGLKDVLGKYMPEGCAIIELGCGPGKNIIWLASQFPERQFIGLDISQNAIDACRKAADHFGVRNVQFDKIDLLDRHHPNWKLCSENLVFTYLAIEQVGRSTLQVLENILNGKPASVVHFENSYEDFDPKNASDWLTKIYIFRKDYVKNLRKFIVHLEKQGRIEFFKSFRFPFSPQIKNDIQVRVWRPKSD